MRAKPKPKRYRVEVLIGGEWRLLKDGLTAHQAYVLEAKTAVTGKHQGVRTVKYEKQ